ncbi:hypothetical protein WCX49_12615 [Sulfurimonas sp. HSL-1656]|uniref:hypothetical protein n=1 Tax=Thiomicrolovo subterrani TaxID=3131934 RepID=UPI0031F73DCC
MFDTLCKSGVAIAAATVLFLSGCGGGGGSGTTSLPTLNVPEANATAANGAEAVIAIFSGQIGGLTGYLPLAATVPQPAGFDATYFMLDKAGPVSKVMGYRTQTLNATYSDSYDCPYGGTMSYTESSTETQMDATVTFSECAFDVNFVMDGKMRMRAAGTNYGDTLSYMEVSFPADFTITDDMYTFYISAGSNMRTDYSEYDDVYGYFAGTMTSSVQWGVDGDMGRYDNLTVVFTEDYYSIPIETYCYKSGRIYVNDLTASLDIDEAYDSYCDYKFYYEDFDLLSGSMRLIGSGGGLIYVNVTDINTITVSDQNGTDINVTL